MSGDYQPGEPKRTFHQERKHRGQTVKQFMSLPSRIVSSDGIKQARSYFAKVKLGEVDASDVEVGFIQECVEDKRKSGREAWSERIQSEEFRVPFGNFVAMYPKPQPVPFHLITFIRERGRTVYDANAVGSAPTTPNSHTRARSQSATEVAAADRQSAESTRTGRSSDNSGESSSRTRVLQLQCPNDRSESESSTPSDPSAVASAEPTPAVYHLIPTESWEMIVDHLGSCALSVAALGSTCHMLRDVIATHRTWWRVFAHMFAAFPPVPGQDRPTPEGASTARPPRRAWDGDAPRFTFDFHVDSDQALTAHVADEVSTLTITDADVLPAHPVTTESGATPTFDLDVVRRACIASSVVTAPWLTSSSDDTRSQAPAELHTEGYRGPSFPHAPVSIECGPSNVGCVWMDGIRVLSASLTPEGPQAVARMWEHWGGEDGSECGRKLGACLHGGKERILSLDVDDRVAITMCARGTIKMFTLDDFQVVRQFRHTAAADLPGPPRAAPGQDVCRCLLLPGTARGRGEAEEARNDGGVEGCPLVASSGSHSDVVQLWDRGLVASLQRAEGEQRRGLGVVALAAGGAHTPLMGTLFSAAGPHTTQWDVASASEVQDFQAFPEEGAVGGGDICHLACHDWKLCVAAGMQIALYDVRMQGVAVRWQVHASAHAADEGLPGEQSPLVGLVIDDWKVATGYRVSSRHGRSSQPGRPQRSHVTHSCIAVYDIRRCGATPSHSESGRPPPMARHNVQGDLSCFVVHGNTMVAGFAGSVRSRVWRFAGLGATTLVDVATEAAANRRAEKDTPAKNNKVRKDDKARNKADKRKGGVRTLKGVQSSS